jgi:hypothetical protein
LRWSLVAIFIWFGIQKFTPYAAEAIVPLIANSPFMRWLGASAERGEANFLKQGHNRIGTAFGSMTEAVNNSTSYLSDSDINAIATYLKSLPATSPQQAVAYNNATTAALLNRPTGERTRLCPSLLTSITIFCPKSSGARQMTRITPLAG